MRCLIGSTAFFKVEIRRTCCGSRVSFCLKMQCGHLQSLSLQESCQRKLPKRSTEYSHSTSSLRKSSNTVRQIVIYRGRGGRGGRVVAFREKLRKSFPCRVVAQLSLFLKLYVCNRATTLQGSFLPSFFSKKRKSHPPRPPRPRTPPTNHNLSVSGSKRDLSVFQRKGPFFKIKDRA